MANFRIPSGRPSSPTGLGEKISGGNNNKSTFSNVLDGKINSTKTASVSPQDGLRRLEAGGQTNGTVSRGDLVRQIKDHPLVRLLPKHLQDKAVENVLAKTDEFMKLQTGKLA